MTKIALLSCGIAKQAAPARAYELYTGSIFVKSRRYAELYCNGYWILSAKHGLVHPDTILWPYDLTLVGQRKHVLAAWGQMVRRQLSVTTFSGAVTFVLLCGKHYAEPIADALRQYGSVEDPMKGREMGYRNSFLTKWT